MITIIVVLGAGYHDGRVALYCVENGKCVHEATLGSVGITTMIWSEYDNDSTQDRSSSTERYTTTLVLLIQGNLQ